jgi:hypothetical protein
MNEQIEKLISQSFTDEQGEQFNIEKFAGLIVQECARLCDNHGNKVEDDRPNKDLSSAAFDCSDIIREHFGVKE